MPWCIRANALAADVRFTQQGVGTIHGHASACTANYASIRLNPVPNHAAGGRLWADSPRCRPKPGSLNCFCHNVGAARRGPGCPLPGATHGQYFGSDCSCACEWLQGKATDKCSKCLASVVLLAS